MQLSKRIMKLSDFTWGNINIHPFNVKKKMSPDK